MKKIKVVYIRCRAHMSLTPPPTDDMDNEDVEPVDSSPWANSDRDYTYEEVHQLVPMYIHYRMYLAGLNC